uniref:Uncharacterized protein n=1 Tax=Rhodnius prolixus TaxID=13249 RepID=T1HK43_RHOPR
MFSPANEHQEGVETYAQRVGGGQSQLEGGTQLKGGRHSWRSQFFNLVFNRVLIEFQLQYISATSVADTIGYMSSPIINFLAMQ